MNWKKLTKTCIMILNWKNHLISMVYLKYFSVVEGKRINSMPPNDFMLGCFRNTY